MNRQYGTSLPLHVKLMWAAIFAMTFMAGSQAVAYVA